jgi:hypothetical protein
MRRISPAGGGGGSVDVIDFNIPKPVRQISSNSTTPTRNQIKVPNMLVGVF